MQAIITIFKSGFITAHIASGHNIRAAYRASTGANHKDAAKRLCEKMDWRGKLESGCTREGWAHLLVATPPIKDPVDVCRELAAIFPGQDPIRTASGYKDVAAMQGQ